MRSVGEAGGDEGAIAQHVGGDECIAAGAALDERESDERNDGEREQPEDRRIGPAVVGALVEGEKQGEEADRERDDTGIVEALAGRGRLVVVDHPPRHQNGERGDRQVEEEDPAPARAVGQGAADERADGVAEAGGAEDQPAGEPGTLLGKDRVGHAEDRRPHHRAADAHQRARGEQHGDVRRDPADEREDGEDHRPEEEDPSPAEHVGETSAGDDEDAEDEGIAVDDPLDRGDVGVELALDRRKSDRKGGEVVGDDEDREAHRHQAEHGGAFESRGCRHRLPSVSAVIAGGRRPAGSRSLSHPAGGAAPNPSTRLRPWPSGRPRRPPRRSSAHPRPSGRKGRGGRASAPPGAP